MQRNKDEIGIFSFWKGEQNRDLLYYIVIIGTLATQVYTFALKLGHCPMKVDRYTSTLYKYPNIL